MAVVVVAVEGLVEMFVEAHWLHPNCEQNDISGRKGKTRPNGRSGINLSYIWDVFELFLILFVHGQIDIFLHTCRFHVQKKAYTTPSCNG